ncbi:hypothetical protein FOL46_003233, partial [Perkinsus olseni]
DRFRTQESAGVCGDVDKIHQITGSPGKDTSSGQKQGRPGNKGSLEDWAKQYPAVWVVTMKQFREEEVRENFKPDDIKRVGMRPKGGVRKYYAVIGYRDADRGGAVGVRLQEVGKRARPGMTEEGHAPADKTSSYSLLKGKEPQGRHDSGEEGQSPIQSSADHTDYQCDRVCLVYLEVPQELRVDVELISAQQPTRAMRKLKATIDPGAGRTYLCVEPADCPLPTKEIMRWAQLADGSKTSIVKAAEVHLTLSFADGNSVSIGPIEVGLLPTGSAGEASMLIGRDVGKLVGLRVDLASGKVTCEASGHVETEGAVDHDGVDLIRYVESE